MKQKLLLIIPSVGCGGAERVMVHLFNHISREKFTVTLVILQERDTVVNNFRRNSSGYYNLKLNKIRNSFIPLIRIIWKIKPNLIFSALPGLNLMIGIIRPFLPKNIKYVVRETSIPSQVIHSLPRLFFQFYYKYLIHKNDMIICQGKFMAEDIISNYQVPPNKIKIIHNPIDFKGINASQPSNLRYDALVIANLNKHKGLQRFLDAVKLLKPEISVGIIGSGPEKSNLEEIITKNELRQVHLLGFQKDPVSFIKQAKVVVQTSYYEGFSNALLESLAAGIPIVAFDVPGGTAEIICDGKNGYLVEDGNIGQLAISIKQAISQNWNHDEIRIKAYEKFNLGKIVCEYESALESMV